MLYVLSSLIDTILSSKRKTVSRITQMPVFKFILKLSNSSVLYNSVQMLSVTSLERPLVSDNEIRHIPVLKKTKNCSLNTPNSCRTLRRFMFYRHLSDECCGALCWPSTWVTISAALYVGEALALRSLRRFIFYRHLSYDRCRALCWPGTCVTIAVELYVGQALRYERCGALCWAGPCVTIAAALYVGQELALLHSNGSSFCSYLLMTACIISWSLFFIITMQWCHVGDNTNK